MITPQAQEEIKALQAQHPDKTVMLIADLAMITGNIGRKGVGVNPLRGQNNVQGAADMGCQPHQGAGYFEVADEKNQKHQWHYSLFIN